jgi:hypothetical protein
MNARYSVRVIQGNNIHTQVPVVVFASSDAEARRKALELTNVHSPRVVIDSIEEIIQ